MNCQIDINIPNGTLRNIVTVLADNQDAMQCTVGYIEVDLTVDLGVCRWVLVDNPRVVWSSCCSAIYCQRNDDFAASSFRTLATQPYRKFRNSTDSKAIWH
ncbi:TPA: hypothetical protein ACH3X2_002793 [Trebouxia sp. C0005]